MVDALNALQPLQLLLMADRPPARPPTAMITAPAGSGGAAPGGDNGQDRPAGQAPFAHGARIDPLPGPEPPTGPPPAFAANILEAEQRALRERPVVIGGDRSKRPARAMDRQV